MPGNRRAASGDGEVVATGLGGHHGIERPLDGAGPPRPDGIPQFNPLIVPEATVDRPRRGDPYAITAVAEIVGERRDEADPSPGLRDIEIARRAARPMQRGN